MDIILNRRSVRKYDSNKKIPYETLEMLCKYGECAPTARKQKSREYIIIEDRNIINSLENIYKQSTMRPSNATAVIAVIGKNLDELPCPDFAPIDLAMATENIMLKATELEIGSVMLGTYPNKERLQAANKLLDLNDGGFVFTFICLGYPLEENAFYDSKKYEDIKITRK